MSEVRYFSAECFVTDPVAYPGWIAAEHVRAATDCPDGYTVRVRFLASHSVEFEVLEFITWNDGRPDFWAEGGGSFLEATPDAEKAERILAGNISWEGEICFKTWPGKVSGQEDFVMMSAAIDRALDLARPLFTHADY